MAPHRVPSASTLYRHRLSVHMGLYRWMAAIHVEMLRGPLVRWGTLDSSPQGSMDWLLSGATVMTMRDALESVTDALTLIELGTGPDSQEARERQHAIVARLEPRLRIAQGTPTGLGSGRSSLTYKVHALAHSVRLCTNTWPDACMLLRSTVSWTADLGTESGISGFHGDASTLFPVCSRRGHGPAQFWSGRA